MTTKRANPKSSHHANSIALAVPPKNYIKKAATVRLQYTTDHYVAFHCFTSDLKSCFLILPAKDASDPKKICSEILSYDLYHTDLPSLMFQAKRAAKARVDRKGTIAISNGWLDDRHGTFVYSDRVFHGPVGKLGTASAPKPLVIACPDFDTGRKSNMAGVGIMPEDMAVARVCKGSGAGWKATVARPALLSSPMMVSIAASFGAPLLSPMDLDSFILFLAGRTSGGKTSTLLPVASAIGVTKDRMPTWKNTEAGLELQAHQEYADMAFPIDELAHVGTELEVFKKIDATAYMFDAGVNKKMQDRAGSAIAGRPRRVTGSRAILITSYERTLAEVEAITGNQFRPGVRVRVLEIPMSVTKEAAGVFDKLSNGFFKGPARASLANKMVKGIRRDCRKHSGRIFIAYIKELVANLPAAKRFVRARMEWFMAHTKFDRLKGEEYRRVEHFAFIYGAGAFAISLNLLPWKRSSLLRAIRACHRASQASMVTAPDPVAPPKATLLQRLGDAQRVVAWPERGGKAQNGPDIDGWARKSGAVTAYRIKASALHRWFPSAQERSDKLQRAVSAGMLVAGKNATPVSKQARVPGGQTRLSVYEFEVQEGKG